MGKRKGLRGRAANTQEARLMDFFNSKYHWGRKSDTRGTLKSGFLTDDLNKEENSRAQVGHDRMVFPLNECQIKQPISTRKKHLNIMVSQCPVFITTNILH